MDEESPEEKMLGRIYKLLEEYLFFINGTPGGKWPYYAKKYVARIKRIVNRNQSAKAGKRRGK
jgi:hypothetical protein